MRILLRDFETGSYARLRVCSWTVITWIIVIGSSVVMLAWIAIYSLFESVDFVDEVVILFGDITFWTSVILSVVIALGMAIIQAQDWAELTPS